jgi:hypothetical protein
MVRISQRSSSFLPESFRVNFVFVWILTVVAVGVWYCQLLLQLRKGPNDQASQRPDKVPPDPMPRSGPSAGKVLSTEAVTIGYFISITTCGSSNLLDGAAVLKHSIHLSSIHGNLGGRYDYQMHAIFHPGASSCVGPLVELGYKLEERNTPVAVDDIRGDFLRSKIVDNGCCGEKELVKLEAYTFTRYPVVVHVDLDVLILKPLDILYDAIIEGTQSKQIAVMWPDLPMPAKVNAFFTRDCEYTLGLLTVLLHATNKVFWRTDSVGMVGGGRQYKPVQGGFLVLRPDKAVYDEYVAILKEGDFQEGKGWGGKNVGPFYGAMTVQGILPYYYDILHPGESVDLNRCIYDQMCDNPRNKKTVDDIVHGNCMTGEVECEDCRSRPLEDIASVHFTICQKPWLCLRHAEDMIQHRLCRKLHHEWFKIRSDLEKSWSRSGVGQGTLDSSHFFGYCSKGRKGYFPIEKPYGKPTELSLSQ